MWRGRSPENVAAEISELVCLGKKDFYFVDPNFVGPGKAGKETAAKLACQLADLGITFGMETRANDITYGLMRELASAGLTRLLLGIESGRPNILKRLGKHTSIAGNNRPSRLYERRVWSRRSALSCSMPPAHSMTLSRT